MTQRAERQEIPVVWALLGGRAGDDAQVLSVAEGVGGALTVHRLDYNGLYGVPNRLLGGTLATLAPQSRAAVRPPWPDLVIGAGRRGVPVMHWLRKRSRGLTKLVQIGRPRAPLHWFDLVVAAPQYRLPQAPNVLHTLLPPISAAALRPGEAERWGTVFAPLPRPWIGLLVGGSRAPYRFDAAAAMRLAAQASVEAKRFGGSLLVSTSPRTGQSEAKALAEALEAPAHLALWSKGEGSAHQAVLALADRFIVTGESVSMMAEACLTGKPLAIFDLPRRFLPSWSGERGLGAILARRGLMSPPRDPAVVHRLLVERGHAAMLGAPEPDAFVPAPDERRRVIEAVRRLVSPAPG
jgi:mitochondrial fission protein ELM1